MDACICPSAADDMDFLLVKAGKGIFQHFLHGGPVLLPLPAMVSGAVVAQAESDAVHSPILRRRIVRTSSTAPKPKAIQSRRAIFRTFIFVRPSPP